MTIGPHVLIVGSGIAGPGRLLAQCDALCEDDRIRREFPVLIRRAHHA
jgi:hypothetical protein